MRTPSFRQQYCPRLRLGFWVEALVLCRACRGSRGTRLRLPSFSHSGDSLFWEVYLSTRKLISTRSSPGRDAAKRVSLDPILTPSDLPPSDPRLQVIGVFNPTFLAFENRRFILVRVDETANSSAILSQYTNLKRTVWIPTASPYKRNGIDLVETEVPESYLLEREPILPDSARRSSADNKHRSDLLLTYISHLRLAELHGDQVEFIDQPVVFPEDEFSIYGCEDPRASLVEGQPFVCYSAIGRFGATSWCARIYPGKPLDARTILLGPDHKHSTMFPERIDSKYYLLSRPLTRSYIRDTGVWLFESTDLAHWGRPTPVLLPRSEMWDSQRVGPAASPIHTPRGWLLFYFGVDCEDSYHVGAAILDRASPGLVLERTKAPLLSPILDWERVGRRADTVFACGVEILDGGNSFRLYYGGADTSIGAADISQTALWDALE